MQPETLKFLEDARQACERLVVFTAGKFYADYEKNDMLRSAVERQFITIGEALLRASKKDPTLDQSITALPRIVGFRNVLVHGYAVVDNQTVWGVVETNLPLLKKQIEDCWPKVVRERRTGGGFDANVDALCVLHGGKLFRRSRAIPHRCRVLRKQGPPAARQPLPRMPFGEGEKSEGKAAARQPGGDPERRRQRAGSDAR
jgi:uncharacterized protein with HEPN domain